MTSRHWIAKSKAEEALMLANGCFKYAADWFVLNFPGHSYHTGLILERVKVKGKEEEDEEVTWGAQVSWWDSTWPTRRTVQSRVTTVGAWVCLCVCVFVSVCRWIDFLCNDSSSQAGTKVPPNPHPFFFLLFPTHTHATIATTDPATHTHTAHHWHWENGSHWCYVLGRRWW